MTARPFPGSSLSRYIHFASGMLFFAGVTSIASLANAAETEEKSSDGAVVSQSPAPKPKNVWAIGLEVSTLKFLGDAAIGPTFGGRLFGNYYFDKKIAAGAGLSYYLPAHYDDMSYGYRLSDPDRAQVQVPIDVSVGPKMVDLELEYHFVGEQLRTDKTFGLYGLAGVSYVMISQTREFDEDQYGLDVQSDASSIGGLAIQLGLGAALKLDPIVLTARGVLGLPVTRVNKSEVEAQFPAFLMGQVGTEFRFD
ncbi:MAG: hypothetical protein ACOY0T_19625 [Myxococcota bacterium]